MNRWMCGADIPVCRSGRLSSRPKQKHGTGMSREPAGWKACATDSRGFMVPMHCKADETVHELPRIRPLNTRGLQISTTRIHSPSGGASFSP